MFTSKDRLCSFCSFSSILCLSLKGIGQQWGTYDTPITVLQYVKKIHARTIATSEVKQEIKLFDLISLYKYKKFFSKSFSIFLESHSYMQ